MKKRKKIRLKDFDYRDGYTYHVTICTKNKKPIFQNKKNAKKLCEILEKEESINNVNILAFCVMYEHIHILVNLKKEYTKDLSAWVKDFKRLSVRFLKLKDLWQKGYYDHIMRSYENMYKTAIYIVNNPVRKNMVTKWTDYEFSAVNYKDE